MFVSAILSVLGLGFMVYVLFALAIYALPFFVAVSVGMHVYDSEAGLIAAFVSAFLAGGATLVAGQIAFATIESVPARLAIGALFAAPAGIAGYHAIKGLSEIGGAGETWTPVFAWIGAIVVGATAWARIASLAGPDEDATAISQAFSGGRAANDG
ncbi:hypothetical protein [Rhizobium sp. EC-SD404]|uniref:hypothetical protein n=1 Tax=Rhizobium sp. EC-SD404 TaxID=2038389 RepID=UPI00125BBEF4|nr:hypothetical protein [Rhizobium sp. EC-SD404]VVT24606.1 conserved membrane hypothetical protein [Rhizobium sp. EC-SD404]